MPKSDQQPNTQLATFGAGCFWGVEETFRATSGVTSTAVGFMGGKKDNPTYEEVCRTETGHAEVVQLEFNPTEISYAELLDVFWKSHDPTQKNRQGPDIGSQYRSAIFYHNEDQRQIAEESKSAFAASRASKREIVTEIEPAQTFYKAEEYHQQYLMKRGQSSCHI